MAPILLIVCAFLAFALMAMWSINSAMMPFVSQPKPGIMDAWEAKDWLKGQEALRFL